MVIAEIKHTVTYAFSPKVTFCFLSVYSGRVNGSLPLYTVVDTDGVYAL